MIRTLKLVGASLLALSFANGVMAQVDECRASGRISCVDLAIGLTDVDNALEMLQLDFEDIGELLEYIQNNPGTLTQINNILNPIVGRSFATVEELYDAVLQCGLIPHVIDLIDEDPVAVK